jgi:DNA polymerase-3 subunit delta
MLDWTKAMDSLRPGNRVDPVHVLVGTDYVLARWYVDALKVGVESGSGMPVEVQRFRFEDEGCSGAVQACQTLSLFAETELVVLENCTALLASGKAKHDVQELERYLESPVDGNVLVITVYGDKLDERKKLTKLAKAHRVVDCNAPKPAAAMQVLRDYAEKRRMQIQTDALQELWRRTQSISAAVTELDKLHTYTGGEPIDLRAVQELVSSPLEDNVFTWIDGVVKGNAAQSFRVLADLQQSGHDTFALYALIGRQLRLLWYAKVLGGKGYSQQQIASRAGAHPYAVKVATEQARYLSQRQIERLLTVLADAEFAVKSGRRDAVQALEWVVMTCLAAKHG